MKIYKFDTYQNYSTYEVKFSVVEMEVVEKEKTYKSQDSFIRKSDIGKFKSYGHEMYLLENDMDAYVEAVKAKHKEIIKGLEERIERESFYLKGE